MKSRVQITLINNFENVEVGDSVVVINRDGHYRDFTAQFAKVISVAKKSFRVEGYNSLFSRKDGQELGRFNTNRAYYDFPEVRDWVAEQRTASEIRYLERRINSLERAMDAESRDEVARSRFVEGDISYTVYQHDTSRSASIRVGNRELVTVRQYQETLYIDGADTIRYWDAPQIGYTSTTLSAEEVIIFAEMLATATKIAKDWEGDGATQRAEAVQMRADKRIAERDELAAKLETLLASKEETTNE